MATSLELMAGSSKMNTKQHSGWKLFMNQQAIAPELIDQASLLNVGANSGRSPSSFCHREARPNATIEEGYSNQSRSKPHSREGDASFTNTQS